MAPLGLAARPDQIDCDYTGFNPARASHLPKDLSLVRPSLVHGTHALLSYDGAGKHTTAGGPPRKAQWNADRP
ncbi:hypothetical protein [Candidatus Villigracilis saccharophilus]|uniref:hypothetical protein n=1 Tax=Candidatus Villigracilis saccharophilus TaxID=3140684 RepID=UPI0031375ACC|nr:hypothetical protein [Anaerolineales bacterium]